VYEKVHGGVEGVQTEQQSAEQYFFFRAQLETALRDLYNTEGRLRFLMGLTASDGRLIRPIDEPTIAEVQFDWRGNWNWSQRRTSCCLNSISVRPTAGSAWAMI
jgi:hypothetical protein